MYVFSIILQILFFIFGAYYFTVSLFAWFKRRERPILTDKTHTFALVVAAHNEEAVIENMVESLKRLNYPKESYDIFVIADNCTDPTAELARKAGANVYERESAMRLNGCSRRFLLLISIMTRLRFLMPITLYIPSF